MRLSVLSAVDSGIFGFHALPRDLFGKNEF